MLLKRPAPASRSDRSGFTIVELAVVIAIMVVAMGMYVSIVAGQMRHRSFTREQSIAAEAARRVVERMHGVPFADAFATYNAEPLDDPGGAGTAPGNRFAVPGLSATGIELAGEVILPALETGPAPPETEGDPPGPSWQLREDITDRKLGLPRDLNGDHLVDTVDHADDYVILPVAVVIRWIGSQGEQTLTLYTLLADMEIGP